MVKITPIILQEPIDELRRRQRLRVVRSALIPLRYLLPAFVHVARPCRIASVAEEDASSASRATATLAGRIRGETPHAPFANRHVHIIPAPLSYGNMPDTLTDQSRVLTFERPKKFTFNDCAAAHVSTYLGN